MLPPDTLSTGLIVLSCVYLAGLVVLAAALLRAPEGFEDEGGFHLGRRGEG